MEIMKLTIKEDFRRGTVFSCFSYHKITLFENKYGIKLIVLTVTVHSSFFPTFDFLKKYVAFCTGFNLLTPNFMLPFIIMDLPLFVIAEWATLVVDICCPRGGS